MSTEKHERLISPRFRNGRSLPAIRILLADDHPVMRIGMGNLLLSEDDMEVIGEAGDGNEVVPKTLELNPDILVLNLDMLNLPGPETVRDLMNSAPQVKIMLLTTAISTLEIIEALQFGARGIVLKGELTDHLVPAVHTVAEGDYWIGGRRVLSLVEVLRDLARKDVLPERKLYSLTPRELEVVGCIVEGFSNRDIAQQFQLSEETVKRHLSNIFDKIGVSTRLELALFAIANELVAPLS